jgi:hypothetical protein
MVHAVAALHALALPLVHAARGIISAAVMLATAEQAVRQLSESVHDQVCLFLSRLLEMQYGNIRVLTLDIHKTRFVMLYE